MTAPASRPPALAIAAAAIVTPLGTLERTWRAIRAGQCVGRERAVPDALLAGAPELDRSIRIALAVARAVLPNPIPPNLGLFCATSKGPVGAILSACQRLRDRQPLTRAMAEQIALGVGAIGAILREQLGLTAPPHTSIAACASGLHALHRAAHAVRAGDCDHALIVAADASLHPLFEASFARLGVLAPADVDGIRRCEPFDPTGRGFFIAEGGAAILLTRATPATPPLAWLEQTWIGGDSTALIAVDPHGASLRAGLSACIRREPIAFIHAHATGTAHDAYELAAIRDTLGPDVPVFSHKQWLGHTLGAAGLIAAVLSIHCHQQGMTPQGVRIDPANDSLTLAQGFGGHIAILRLRGPAPGHNA